MTVSEYSLVAGIQAAKLGGTSTFTVTTAFARYLEDSSILFDHLHFRIIDCPLMLFAAQHLWPDALDLVVTFLLLSAMIALTVSGHVLTGSRRASMAAVIAPGVDCGDGPPAAFPPLVAASNPTLFGGDGTETALQSGTITPGLSPRSKKAPPRPRRRPQTLHATAGRF